MKDRKYRVDYVNSEDKSAHTEVQAINESDARVMARKSLGRECYRVVGVQELKEGKYFSRKSLQEDASDRRSEMQSNPTYKKMADICKKYGYDLRSAFIGSHNSVIIEITSDRSNRYLPDIYFDGVSFGEVKNEFRVQTTSYGALDIEEHMQFVSAVTNAHNMVVELGKTDFDSLYRLEKRD